MDNSRMYMPKPENTLGGKAERLFRRLSYDLWRRELKRYLRSHGDLKRPTIVDVGCGPGFLVNCLENWFPQAEVIGIDSSDELLDVARSRCEKVRFLKGDACSLPIGDGSADVLFILHVIEHLPEPSNFFAEAQRVLRPGGLLVVATPNSEGLGYRLMKQNWQGFSDPTHISLKSISSWRDVVTGSGFKIVRDGTTGLTGIPILNRMPLGLIHWVPTFIFGHFSWQLGEAYICTAQKPTK
jgi:SAM-dependent methyltransferase